ncbi:hypothetical protein MPF19_16685 [Polaribacter sp. Z014]|uniref:hypothetical protein n=1 Tax=Polaribacter sp. Z014 TaxID=2927126 RepID=UPI002020111A|nr:hypothetical protein [Polaribacter sp. Z014]MCL7765062.1 hypothetical protein [Polaribacter sp. Z014]
MKILNILITPSYESTRDAMGFSEEEDYNSDAVLFQQGYNMDILKLEPGEEFTISDDFKGQVDCEETQYKFIELKEEWEDEPDDWDEDYYEEGDPIDLLPGRYHFLEDGITIKELS